MKFTKLINVNPIKKTIIEINPFDKFRFAKISKFNNKKDIKNTFKL
jgi:hypothetical protein